MFELLYDSAGFDPTEHIIDKLTVEQLLQQLTEEQQVVLSLLFGLSTPADWPSSKLERWPPRLEDIGEYIGNKYRDGPVTEGTVRYIRDQSFALLRQMSIATFREIRKAKRIRENPEY